MDVILAAAIALTVFLWVFYFPAAEFFDPDDGELALQYVPITIPVEDPR